MKFDNLRFYEIYPTSFYDSNNDGIGDLKGIEEKLSYVKELGFNAIWLNPFYKSPFKDGGYDVSDYFQVDEKFGTMDDYKSLLKRAHELGIKIIIDLVPGHTSEEHELFQKSGAGTKNEYYDMFIWNSSPWELEQPYRLIAGRTGRFGCYMVNFFSTQPALNYGFAKIDYPKWQLSYEDPITFKTRDYLISVIKFWLELGTDGFRVDMADSLVKNDDDKEATIKVWNYIFDKVKKEYPDSFFVSEWANPERSFRAGFDCDFALDHWDNFFHRYVRSNETTRGPSVLNGGPLDYFEQDLIKWLDFAKRYQKHVAIISGNHDTPRIASFLDETRSKLFYLTQYTLPGIPFVYYGDEIGLKHRELPSKDGGYQRTGDRTPMQWNKEKHFGFSKTEAELYLPVGGVDEQNVEEEQKNLDSLYHFIKKLNFIRNDIKELTEYDFEYSSKDRVITYRRGEYKIVINLSTKTHKIDDIKDLVISTNAKKKDLHVVEPLEGVLYLERRG